MSRLLEIVCLGSGALLLSSTPVFADYIYASDTTGGMVNRFDSSGNKSVFLSGLNHPTGLAFDSAGNLYVANSGNGTIEKFGSNGTGTVFASGLNNPTGLAFDQNGNLFVDSSGDGTITKFDPYGSGSTFASGLNLYGFAYLAFDNGGNLFASTISTIERFDAGGLQSSFFQTLAFVYGLAFDRDGNFYVSLENFESILIFRPGVSDFERYPFSMDGAHPYPAGMAVGSNNHLYVAAYDQILDFDSPGNFTVFAPDLDGTEYLAIQSVPEPSFTPALIMAAAVAAVRKFRRFGS